MSSKRDGAVGLVHEAEGTTGTLLRALEADRPVAVEGWARGLPFNTFFIIFDVLIGEGA